MGTLGLGPTPLAFQTDPGVSKGKGPSTGWPTKAEPILHPDISRGFKPRHWPAMSTRLVFRLGGWGFDSSDGSFSSNADFPERQFSRTKLPAGFLSYKQKFIHELTSSPSTKQGGIPNIVPIWKAVIHKGNKSPFPK